MDSNTPDILKSLLEWSPALIMLFALWVAMEWAVRNSRSGTKSRLVSLSECVLQKKKCPACGEIVRLDAAICKHCGHRIDQRK